MNEDKNSQQVSDKYVWQSLAILVMILIGGIVALICFAKWVILPIAKGIVLPSFLSYINWFVPHFWNFFGFIFILWLVYKFFSFIWSPVYALLGKWSYLPLIATIIYIAMRII